MEWYFGIKMLREVLIPKTENKKSTIFTRLSNVHYIIRWAQSVAHMGGMRNVTT
jgi:hypothetical protein